MFDIKWIREHPESFDQGLKRRKLSPLSQRLISIDELRRARIRVLERKPRPRRMRLLFKA
jgi:seryl-tRNA synthetase